MKRLIYLSAALIMASCGTNEVKTTPKVIRDTTYVYAADAVNKHPCYTIGTDTNKYVRFFLVQYQDGSSYGNLGEATGGGYPSNEFMRKSIKKRLGFKNPVIVNIMEFKCAQDYYDFWNSKECK